MVGACALMAGFVLIHGSWHGGWCFDPVAELLRARGHVVIAPTLPAMGGTAAEMAAITLGEWGEYSLSPYEIRIKGDGWDRFYRTYMNQ